MSQIPSLQEMLEAGVHFGHQTRRWNPRMKPYILTARNGIYVINLEKTLEALQRAVEKILRVRATGASVLFVGTKPTIQGAVRDEATRAGQPYVTTRWLGGMLTNYQTIRKSIKHLEDIERMENEGVLTDLTKKEASELMTEKADLQDVFGGIRNLRTLPGLVFIADAKTDKILGAQILGHNAGELIGEIVAHMEYGGSAEDLARTIHAHPTMSESIKEAALAVSKSALHAL